MEDKMMCPFTRKECMEYSCRWLTLMVDKTGEGIACCSMEMIAYTLESIKDLIENVAYRE